MGIGIRIYPLIRWRWECVKSCIPVGFGDVDVDEFLLWEWGGIMIPVPTPPRCHPNLDW